MWGCFSVCTQLVLRNLSAPLVQKYFLLLVCRSRWDNVPQLCLACGGWGTPRDNVAESEKEGPKPGTTPESSNSSSRIIFMAVWLKNETFVFYPQPKTSQRADPHSSPLLTWGRALGWSQGQQVNPLKWWACLQPCRLPRCPWVCQASRSQDQFHTFQGPTQM